MPNKTQQDQENATNIVRISSEVSAMFLAAKTEKWAYNPQM